MKTICENIKPIMAILTLAFGFLFLIYIVAAGKETPEGILIAVVAILREPFAYYYGNSTGGAKKDEIISDLTKKQ